MEMGAIRVIIYHVTKLCSSLVGSDQQIWSEPGSHDATSQAGRERPTSAQQHLKGPGFTNKEREMMPAVFRHKAGLFLSANLPVLHLPAETVDTQADCP